jgi:hypothetical protein
MALAATAVGALSSTPAAINICSMTTTTGTTSITSTA